MPAKKDGASKNKSAGFKLVVLDEKSKKKTVDSHAIIGMSYATVTRTNKELRRTYGIGETAVRRCQKLSAAVAKAEDLGY